MLKYDGTVDYYLDPDDYTKKEDGTASDVANSAYAGNAMIEWGQNGRRIYYKVVPDSGSNVNATVYIADGKPDDDFKDWSFINNQGVEVDHFYTPIYNGSEISSKLRSISGQTPVKSKTATQEMTLAKEPEGELKQPEEKGISEVGQTKLRSHNKPPGRDCQVFAL